MLSEPQERVRSLPPLHAEAVPMTEVAQADVPAGWSAGASRLLTALFVIVALETLYAEKGRTAEAYRIIVQAIGAKPDEAPGADDWYVFGRLAEQYGLPDVARKYYRKVTPPKSLDAEPMSTHALATRRLGALGEEKKPQRRAAL